MYERLEHGKKRGDRGLGGAIAGSNTGPPLLYIAPYTPAIPLGQDNTYMWSSNHLDG